MPVLWAPGTLVDGAGRVVDLLGRDDKLYCTKFIYGLWFRGNRLAIDSDDESRRAQTRCLP